MSSTQRPVKEPNVFESLTWNIGFIVFVLVWCVFFFRHAFSENTGFSYDWIVATFLFVVVYFPLLLAGVIPWIALKYKNTGYMPNFAAVMFWVTLALGIAGGIGELWEFEFTPVRMMVWVAAALTYLALLVGVLLAPNGRTSAKPVVKG